MSGFVEGIDRSQSSLFPAELQDYVAEDNPVRAVDAFVDGLDLGKLGFGRVIPLEKGRPCYHPATLLKIYIYGYLNRVPSSRRLERECQRNIELVWLTAFGSFGSAALSPVEHLRNEQPGAYQQADGDAADDLKKAMPATGRLRPGAGFLRR